MSNSTGTGELIKGKALILARAPLVEEDAKYSSSFPGARAIVEEIGMPIPLSLYFLVNNTLPEATDTLRATRDGGRCVILPQPHELDGKQVFVGIKGTGYNADTTFLNPKDGDIKAALDDYLEIKADSKDPSLDLFITSRQGSSCGIGSDRPLGGQSRQYAEWSLEFSNMLSTKFKYKGAHFVPTVAVIGHDSKAKEVIGKLNDGNHIFNPANIVEEYRLLPSGLNLEDFLYLPDETISHLVRQTGHARFKRNLQSSLYHLAAFPMNTISKEKLEYLDLNPPYGGSLLTESVIAPDGKVYWKDLDNLAVSLSVWHQVSEAYTGDKEAAMDAIKRYAEASAAEYIAIALDYVSHFNIITCPKTVDDLTRAKETLDGFISVMEKAKGTRFTWYEMSKDETNNNEYWNMFRVKLAYYNKVLGNGTINLCFKMRAEQTDPLIDALSASFR